MKIAIHACVASALLLSLWVPTYSFAAGYTKTKEQCRKLGGDPTAQDEQGRYFCNTIKQDNACKKKNKKDPDYYCYQYNVQTKKCELDVEGLMLDDCY